MAKFSPDEYRHESNAVSLLNYHLVFIPKKRKKCWLVQLLSDCNRLFAMSAMKTDGASSRWRLGRITFICLSMLSQ